MTYCAMCRNALLERTLRTRKLLLCSTCGAIYEELPDGKFRYMGTTNGNQQMRELLAVIDSREEEQPNEVMAFKTNPVT